jgi:hypothetical protein
MIYEACLSQKDASGQTAPPKEAGHLAGSGRLQQVGTVLVGWSLLGVGNALGESGLDALLQEVPNLLGHQAIGKVARF